MSLVVSCSRIIRVNYFLASFIQPDMEFMLADIFLNKLGMRAVIQRSDTGPALRAGTMGIMWLWGC